MEQHRKRFTVAGGLLAALLAIFFAAAPAAAKDECSTVKECTEKMVVLANDLKKENAALLARLNALEIAIAKQAADQSKAVETRLDRMKKTGVDQFTNRGGNGESALCAAGSYMVGTRWQIDSGGGHGQISNIFPICRTMP